MGIDEQFEISTFPRQKDQRRKRWKLFFEGNFVRSVLQTRATLTIFTFFVNLLIALSTVAVLFCTSECSRNFFNCKLSSREKKLREERKKKREKKEEREREKKKILARRKSTSSRGISPFSRENRVN